MAMSSESDIAFRELGSGFPIVFIHGWELNGDVEARDFEPSFEGESGFRRLYIDLPAMGGTEALGVSNLDDIQHQIERFVDAHLEKEHFAVVGSSCGAYHARRIAHIYSDRVDGLLLHVPLVEPDDSARDVDKHIKLVSNEQSVSERASGTSGTSLIETPEYIAALKQKTESYQEAEDMCKREVVDRIRNDRQRYRLSELSDMATLTIPVLILCGRQDTVVGYRDAFKLIEYYPRATFAILDRETHSMPVVQNDVFRHLVRDWLARLERSRKLAKTGE